MHTHRNPQTRLSNHPLSGNFNTIDATYEPLSISPHLRLVEIDLMYRPNDLLRDVVSA